MIDELFSIKTIHLWVALIIVLGAIGFYVANRIQVWRLQAAFNKIVVNKPNEAVLLRDKITQKHKRRRVLMVLFSVLAIAVMYIGAKAVS